MGCFQQFRALMWKNALLKYRRKFQLLMELLLPPIFVLVLVAIRSIIVNAKVDAQVFDPKPIPSLTSYFNLNNTDVYNKDFLTGGAANFFVQCDLNNAIKNRAPFNPLIDCKARKFAVLPLVAGDAGTEDAAAEFVKYMSSQLPKLVLNNSLTGTYLMRFASQANFDAYLADVNYGLVPDRPKVGGAVVFYAGGPGVYKWDYSLRFNYTQESVAQPIQNLPTTRRFVDDLQKNVTLHTFKYTQSGFLAWQRVVDNYIINRTMGVVNAVGPGLALLSYPTREYMSDPFWGQVSTVFALFMIIAQIYPISNIIKQVVLEKENKIREGMRMMSLNNGAFYWSWFVTCFIQFILTAALMTAVSAKGLFKYSDLSVIYVYYLLFLMSSTSFAFFITVFFSKSKTAAVGGTLIYFCAYFPYTALNSSDVPGQAKTLAGLLPPTAFALGTIVFAEYEGGQVGVRWDNLSKSAGDLTFASLLGIMFFDIFLYGTAAWYLDNVIASEWGTARKWYFCLTPAWCCGVDNDAARRDAATAGAAVQPMGSSGNPNEEAASAQLRSLEAANRCVSMVGLKKTFKTAAGIKTAVDGLDLVMYEGQITALLGHNGAGKTTAISMLTGLVPVTSGSASVNGRSVITDMGAIRQNLGVCPQHNILWDELSVLEHLQLFGLIKGMPAGELDAACDKMIREVGLVEKRNAPASTLSGGMKRKLSLGIALLGPSKVIFLDEPTSGMDPYSRRFTWDVIKRHREGRTIVLTTHFMDEADLLGDRIAIMAEGKLRCVGSSLFLKKRFGVGYTMTLVKSMSGCDEKALRAIVQATIPAAAVLSNVGTEMSFQLPLRASGSFQGLLETLDSRKSELGIVEYGMSVTTLEEVFLRVAHGTEDIASENGVKRSQMVLDGGLNDGGVKHEEAGVPMPSHGLPSDVPPSARALFGTHIKALLIKRALYFSRDRRAWCCQLLAPLIFLLLGMLILRIRPDRNQPMYKFTTYDLNVKSTNARAGTRTVLPTPTPLNLDLSSAAPPAAFAAWDTHQLFMAGSEPLMPTNVSVNYIADIGPYFTAPVTDVNATGMYLRSMSHNMSAVLLVASSPGSVHAYKDGVSSYAGWVVTSPPPPALPPLGSNASSLALGLQYVLMYNNTGIHAAPLFTNIIHRALLALLSSQLGLPPTRIDTRTHPFTQTALEKLVGAGVDSLTVSLFIVLAFGFVPASFAIFVVREREEKSKHLQLVSGVSKLAYWLSTWIWDVVSFLLPFAMVMILLFAFDVQALIGTAELVQTIVGLFLLFGMASASFTYCVSFLFSKHASAQTMMVFLNFVTGVILMIAAFVMFILEDTRSVNDALVWVYRLFPIFCLGEGLLNCGLISVFRIILGDRTLQVTAIRITGADTIYLAVESVVYFLLCLYIESQYDSQTARKWWTSKFVPDSLYVDEPEDADVVLENNRVASGAADHDVILLKQLRKVYPSAGGKTKVAVKRLSMGIPNGECFGLLGINGAGKTSTLSILSGEFPPTSGSAFLAGKNIVTHGDETRRLIGYCPQFDALFGLMTGREHLELYARVKGTPEHLIKGVVDKKISELDLTDHASREAGGYSGGNKRKLSVAIAMTGGPKIVFLDEPSTGMDPVARRFMWDVINRISTLDKSCSIILTTHSMEECEALCTRIGIMVGGRLQCLGSSQHLKNRHGMGYQMEISAGAPTDEAIEALRAKMFVASPTCGLPEATAAITAAGHADLLSLLAPTASGSVVYFKLSSGGSIPVTDVVVWILEELKAAAIVAWVHERFPGAHLRERHGGHMRYEIPHSSISLGAMFGLLEKNRLALDIESYALSQTSLEQVFNRFAALQEEETGVVAGILSK